MTLYRQLIMFLLLLLLILFIGTWFAKLKNTHSFLVEQMESHASDTATFLGLSLQPHLAENDIPTVETMINAVFDRGYYQSIVLRDVHDNSIIERENVLEIVGIPQWFIDTVPIKSPGADTVVMAGWSRFGNLFVITHPGYAYKTLWNQSVELSAWFALVGICLAVISAYGIRVLLAPLKRVEHQASELCKRNYVIQGTLPRTRELRRVVEAMNRMTGMVKNMFLEQSETAHRLREQTYRDSLTGLGNRRYLDAQLRADAENKEEIQKGGLMIIQVHGLDKLNSIRGYQAGDAFLEEVAQCLKVLLSDTFNCVLARLNGGDFCVYFKDVSANDVTETVKSLVAALAELAERDVVMTRDVCHVGVCMYEGTFVREQLLAGADQALLAAQQHGPNTYVIQSMTISGSGTVGRHSWKTVLIDVLEKKKIRLFGQQVVDAKNHDEILHTEFFCRIVLEDGGMLNAGFFLPLAEKFELAGVLDRVVIERLIARMKEVRTGYTLAVNVAMASILNQEFRGWLLATLAGMPQESPKLIFELKEFSALQHLEELKSFKAEVNKLGHGIALDHFGQGFANFGYLLSLRPEYVKIGRGYTVELESHENDASFFIRSLCSVAHSLDIQVIAEGVEHASQLLGLKNLPVDGVQGYMIDEPKNYY